MSQKPDALPGGVQPSLSSADAGDASGLEMSRVIVEQSPVILFRRTPPPDYTLVYVSENISRLGYDARELLSGKVRFTDLIHPDDRERLRAELRESEAAGATRYRQSYRLVRRDGQVRWVEDSTSAVLDDQGNILFYQGIVADVTERWQAEEALRRSEEKFRRIVETAAEGFVMLDTEFRIVDVNAAYCRLLGYSREELLGRQPMELAAPGYRSVFQSISESITQRPVRIFESRYRRKDGSEVPALIHGNTLLDDAGEILGHVGFVSDLSEQKRSLRLAAEVQRSLLPAKCLRLGNLEVAGRSLPWEEVGGDLFDLVTSADGTGLTIVVGDIAGHGVDSALLMATARAVLREHLGQGGSLAGVLSAANASLYRDFLATSRFMTMFLLHVQEDPAGRVLRWARAGHDPAVIYCPVADAFRELSSSGMPLGVLEHAEYQEEQGGGLHPGSLLLVGTDGIWETRRADGEFYGKARFHQLVRGLASQPVCKILEAVYADLLEFTDGAKPQDDITLVIAKAH